MHADDVVGVCVVVLWTSENLVPHLLLVNDLYGMIQHALAKIEKHVVETGGLVEVAAGGKSFDEQLTAIGGARRSSSRHTGNRHFWVLGIHALSRRYGARNAILTSKSGAYESAFVECQQ